MRKKIKEEKMARVKLPLKKVENKTKRNVSFAKRKNGLVKKAYELSTFCDVDVGLVIFSSAGNLVLFGGKRRTEKILKRYIDLPYGKRGRYIFIFKMFCDMDHRMVEIELEGIQDEIILGNVELEDLVKQLENFIKSTKYIKSITEVEYQERVLEDTMKLISLHKQVVEEKGFSQLQLLSQTLHPQTACASNFMMGSPNSDLGWPQRHDPTQFLTNNFANSTGFEPSRNESDTFAEMFPTSMAFNGTGYTVGNAANGDSDMLQFSMAFNGAGHPDGNALSGVSNQLTSSMVFSGTEYLAGNEVSGGSDQFEYGLLPAGV
ncbi:hypothetical protein JRO89_XS10G0039200 [Xanthoceras sorbifolium]|uniref:MADS-box domain-containing protein n=1 Tax=Xanthoceras sorbifolium TaxID=99658 RepID=A0ABQ8HHH5_9ROSI|nr:hypothetical protein JRO89_XS10G0039200 [Xanthoceras sorbifolium]